RTVGSCAWPEGGTGGPAELSAYLPSSSSAPMALPVHATCLAESCPGAGAAITVAAPAFFFGPDWPGRGFDGTVSLGGSCSPGGVVICCHADFGRWGSGPPAAFTQ